MSGLDLGLWLGAALFALGAVRMLLARDLIVRLVSLNVAGSGALVLLVALAGRDDPPDPVPQALVLTGIVITVSFTAVGLAIVRHLEAGTGKDDDER